MDVNSDIQDIFAIVAEERRLAQEKYDALLSVLRQCVEAMEHINNDFAMAFIASGGHKETNDALAAAKPYLESKEEEK